MNDATTVTETASRVWQTVRWALSAALLLAGRVDGALFAHGDYYYRPTEDVSGDIVGSGTYYRHQRRI